MKFAVLPLAVVVLMGVAQDPAGEAEDRRPAADRGVLAVLRRDGIMFPFAAFRGTYWSAPWPGPLRNIELPINVESISERWWGGWRPDSFHAWFADGSSRPVRAIEPSQFQIHCAPRLGIRTDHRTAEALPMLPTEPFPKDGLVVTAGVDVARIEIVEKGEAWSALAVELLEAFNRTEDLELRTVQARGGWRHPFESRARRELPVRLESWYRTRLDDGATVSYVEAARSYPPQPEDGGCGLETIFSGWVYQKEGKLSRRADLGARLTYCDRVNAAYMLPFGRITVRDRVYWIAQLSGHESEWYAVAGISGSRAQLVAEYFAGSRDSCIG